MFNEKRVVEMYISDNDIFALEWANRVLKPIFDKMDNERADYIENLETGELIEYDEFEVALRVINSLREKVAGRDWKLV